MFNNVKIWWHHEKPGKPRGFTLVELIIAMLVFTIFIGVVASVYISVTRSLRHASEVRKVYAEARYLMDRVTQDVRLFTVDYDCLDGYGTSNNECVGFTEGRLLPLISADGMERLVYEYDPDDKTFSIFELEYDGSNWVTSAGYLEGPQYFVSDSVSLDDIHFDIYPLDSPYHGGVQYQPSVHVVIGATSASAFLPQQLNIILQSTISSRVYGVTF
jgi:prepilin-type N-terminal cleavage/methylation domain-containing protein